MDYESAGILLHEILADVRQSGIESAQLRKLYEATACIGDPVRGTAPPSEQQQTVKDAVSWLVKNMPKYSGGSGILGKVREICDKFNVPLPDPEENGKKRLLEIEDLEDFIAEEGIEIKYDVVRQCTMISGHNVDSFPAWCTSRLRNRYGGVTPNIIREYLNDIINHPPRKYDFNPVSEIIDGTIWDGKNRIDELCDMITVDPDDILSRTLICKWLIQCYVLATRNEDKKREAEGILCLIGGQGAGKSTFCHRLVMDESLINDDPLNVKDKDSKIRMTRIWIGELGEIGATMGNDINELKNFITKKKDSIRLPYGYSDTETPRRTSYIATTNDVRFLVDRTGNRRWWIVPLTVQKPERFDREKINGFDYAQLWAQVKNIVETLGEDAYKLTVAELEMLEERNVEHEKTLPGAEELQAIWDDAELNPTRYEKRVATLKEMKEAYPEILRRYGVRQIRDALEQIGCEEGRDKGHTKNGDDRKRGFMFPMPKHSESSTIRALKERGIG